MAHTTLRRQQLADAAISTLARSGMRGLTHRAVDQTAEVPAGSCSYYFRTRRELLQAAVERLAELDLTEIDERPALTGPASITQIAEATAGLIEHWTTAGRERMLARYELALEAPRRPELRAALHTAGSRHRAVAENMLAAAGAPDPAAHERVRGLPGRPALQSADRDSPTSAHPRATGANPPHPDPHLRRTAPTLIRGRPRTRLRDVRESRQVSLSWADARALSGTAPHIALACGEPLQQGGAPRQQRPLLIREFGLDGLREPTGPAAALRFERGPARVRQLDQ